MYYHGGRKTLRVFRVSDGVMIANYRVSSHLSSVESTTDGKSVALGMVDGSVTVLTIADPKKQNMSDYLKNLPSRRGLLNIITNSRTTNKKLDVNQSVCKSPRKFRRSPRASTSSPTSSPQKT